MAAYMAGIADIAVPSMSLHCVVSTHLIVSVRAAQLGKVYTTLTSSLLVLWWIYPIGESRMQLMSLPGSVQLLGAASVMHNLHSLQVIPRTHAA